MKSEDGEGMEPPNSVQNDQSPAAGDDGEADGFSIVDGPGDSQDDSDATHDASSDNIVDVDEENNPDVDVDVDAATENGTSEVTKAGSESEEAATKAADDSKSTDGGDSSTDDELSVDDWLAAAAGDGTGDQKAADKTSSDKKAADKKAADTKASDDARSGAEVADDDGANMSEIMAELLAAAEKSEADADVTDASSASTIAAPTIPTRAATDTTTDKKADAATEATNGDGAASKADTKAGDSTPAKSDKTPDEKTSSVAPKTKSNSKWKRKKRKGASDKSAPGETPPSDDKKDADDKAPSDGKKTVDGKAASDDKATSDSKKTVDDKGASDDEKTDDSKKTVDQKTDDKTSSDDGKKTSGKAEDTEAAKEKTKAAITSVPAKPGLASGPKRSSFPVLKAAVLTVIGLYALLVAAWGVDMARHNDRAMRGVQLTSVDVGGLDRTELEDTVDGLTNDLGDLPLEVTVGDATVITDPVSLGARLDRNRMVDEALAARRSGLFFIRPLTWAAGLFSTETIEARYLVDTDVAGDAATEVIENELDQAIEPTLQLEGSRMTVTPGSPGVAIEPREIVGRLPAAIEAGEPYELTLIPRDSEPEFETATISELADEINDRTEEAIAFQVLDDEAEVSPRMLKSWIDLEVVDGEPTWVVSEERALEDLKPLFPGLGAEDQQATFKVVNEEPIIVPASETVICCATGISEDLRRAIDRSLPAMVTEEDENGEEIEVQPLRTITLAPEVTGFDEGVAELESLGIVEQVSTFTTKHACCANRVTNIQRFADLMQGVIIRPGEELSLNGFVGMRTRENGFVADGAIALGNFEQQVGGGISQYATTFFNASFFAGVEFLEYQSHSIYISRYPRGREATISWRKPDLKIRNNTEYGILVWNEYTPTSITVSFYSTKHLTVEALPLKRSSDRQCRIDITPRLITYPDGSQSEDRVFASYRPGEGLDCNGNSTTPEEDPPEPAAQTAAPPPAPAPAPDPPAPAPGEVLPGG